MEDISGQKMTISYAFWSRTTDMFMKQFWRNLSRHRLGGGGGGVGSDPLGFSGITS